MAPGPFASLSFEFGGVVAQSIVVDNVHVVADCTDVATESANWGSLKAWYQ